MSYSTLHIFQDSTANALVDRIYYEIARALPDLVIDDVFALSGQAAMQLQGAAAKDCSNIIFVTKDASLYAFFQDTLPVILSARAVRFLERTVFYFDMAIVEVWLEPDAIVIKGSVAMQSNSDINPILL